ncbi:FAD-binding oxidoreductase [uncultured Thiothrix sp.]|uniref:FAD-binding oxidoreductase n=1 Tax=uncultured Thiothrix sp. TaxID=223185 RepID=UPI002621A988|nr:FAD-binding oxidoreductase [uncultured Thiothrix sp.]
MQIDVLRQSFSGRLYTSATDMEPFLTDWRKKWKGDALAVVQPDTTEDVAAIVRLCHQQGVPVVPQGGNTGLSGGATPDNSKSAILLSLARLKRIRSIDIENNSLVAEAGVILEEIHQAASKVNRLFPLKLASQGSCTIGGNLATNAGGIQVLRYGNTRELCLGVEVVTPEGEIWNGLCELRKNNTGYSLRDLYIGSEGTLGIITAAAIKLFPIPTTTLLGILSVPTPEAALHLLHLSQGNFGAELTAFEIMSDFSVSLVEKNIPDRRLPLTERGDWYVFLEISSLYNEEQVRAAFEQLLERGMEAELIRDGLICQNMSQFTKMWAIREDIAEAQVIEGKSIKHDISVPLSKIAACIDAVTQQVEQRYPALRQVVYGHIGDGNLHYNFCPAASEYAADFMQLEAEINRQVHDIVDQCAGSISAEHGLGVLRRDEAARYKSATEIKLMSAIKKALDPHSMMNPGKVLR